MAGYVGGAPPPAPSRRDVLNEKFPEAIASGRVQLDQLAPPSGLDTSSAPGAPQGGYKVRTLAEQLAENRRKADEDYMEEYKPKGPKALDDEEFEFIEGTQLARLKRRLLEEAEEKEALAEFHQRKASMVHDSTEVLLVAKPDVPDVAKKSLAPASKPAAPALKIIAVAKPKATAAAPASASSSSPVTPPAASKAASSSAAPPAKASRKDESKLASPSSASSTPNASPAKPSATPAPAGLALLGAYADSDEER